MATILEIASGSEDFEILVSVVSLLDDTFPEAGLIDLLSDETADITVFAPTDAAFGQLAVDLGFGGDTADEAAVTTFLAGTLAAETLLDVILYHVSSGAQTAADISASDSVTTLFGETIAPEGPTLGDLEPDLIDPSVVAPDIVADNGIIQGIDRVLLPFDLDGNDAPTVTGIVAASGGTFDDDGTDFDLLLTAVVAADLDGLLDDPSIDVTVFAPNDAAFLNLATTLGFDGTDEGAALSYILDVLALLGGGDPIPVLTDVLEYHVAPTSLQASQVLIADEIDTLEGITIGVDGTSLVDQDPDVANPNLIATDIQAANGVVHVIDSVLLPADLLPSNGSPDGVIIEIGDETGGATITGRDNDLIDANGGDDLIFARAGDDIVDGGDGDDDLIAGEGDDRLTGGTGDDTLVGEEGADTFVFASGFGTDTILDFVSGEDLIELQSLTLADIAGVSQDGGDFVIDFGNGDALILEDTTRADISPADLIFV